MPKWKTFFPNPVKFSRNLGFLRWFLKLAGKNFGYLKTLFVPFIVLKTTVSIPRFQCKNQFEKLTALGQDIWEKPKWGCGLVSRAMFEIFLQISRHRVVRFSNRSFHWNRGIKTVVLSTIIDTNGAFKYQKKKIPRASKVTSKTLNCGKIWPDWEKRLFRGFLKLAGKFFWYLKTPFVPIIVLKTTVSIPQFQWKDRFE